MMRRLIPGPRPLRPEQRLNDSGAQAHPIQDREIPPERFQAILKYPIKGDGTERVGHSRRLFADRRGAEYMRVACPVPSLLLPLPRRESKVL